MLVFELTAGRTIHRWDTAPSAPRAAKAVAILSLSIWVGVIFMGRLIGFTTKPGAVVAPPSNENFDNFLGGGAPDSGAPPATPPAAPAPDKK